MIKVGNTCIAISSIDPSFICLYFNLLLWLDIVVVITTTIAASWLLLCFDWFYVCRCCHCDHAKVAATALAAAATFCVSYATLLFAACFCAAFVIGWLLVIWLFLFCFSAAALLPMRLPLLFCRWFCHCSCRHNHPFAAHCAMVTLLLLLAAVAIAITTGWLLLLFVLLWLLWSLPFACDAATAWLSSPFHAP